MVSLHGCIPVLDQAKLLFDQASPRAMDAPRRFVLNLLAKLLLTLDYQNGSVWAVRYVLMIVRRALLPNCASSFRFSVLIALTDNVQSALVQANPKTADAKFKKHW